MVDGISSVWWELFGFGPITMAQNPLFSPNIFSALPLFPQSLATSIASTHPASLFVSSSTLVPHIRPSKKKKMLSATRSLAYRKASLTGARFFSTTLMHSQKAVSVTFTPEEQAAAVQKQSPNRAETWAPSQKPRSEALSGVRIVQRDLAAQPQPYAAIDLIAKQPVVFLHDSSAVCDGGRGVQGHPKIFINLDKPGTHACQYCK